MVMKPMVLSHKRHAVLVYCLEQHTAPVDHSTHFRLYPLNPDEHAAGSPAEIVVVHQFTPAQIDNNIGYYVANELLPLLAESGMATLHDYSEHDLFESYVGAVVCSVEKSERQAWHLFYTNTLAALRNSIAAELSAPATAQMLTPAPGVSTQLRLPRRWTDDIPEEQNFIGNFGAIYQHTLRLIEDTPPNGGSRRTLLDAGTCFGLFALLLASDDVSPVDSIVGCDINTALIQLASDYAQHRQLHNVAFTVADLLGNDIERLGVFDSVTAIHLLEHIEQHQTEQMIANLWKLTGQRLIITVPLEDTPDPRFGHLQAFDQQRLLALGEQVGGICRYFEHCGGWIVIDRC